MLGKPYISLRKLREIERKKEEEEYNTYLNKLDYILKYSYSPKAKTSKVIDIINFINEVQEIYGNKLTDAQIKAKIDKLYNSLNTKRRNKKYE